MRFLPQRKETSKGKSANKWQSQDLNRDLPPNSIFPPNLTILQYNLWKGQRQLETTFGVPINLNIQKMENT